MTSEDTTQLTDPRALRALAHPARIALLRELGSIGPAKVSDLADAVNEAPNSVSFHLRQLAKYGLVRRATPPAEASRRESWWELVGRGASFDPTKLPEGAAAAEAMAALDGALVAMLEDRHQRVMRALRIYKEMPEMPCSIVMSSMVLTPAQARELDDALQDLVKTWSDRAKQNQPVEGGVRFDVAIEVFPDVPAGTSRGEIKA